MKLIHGLWMFMVITCTVNAQESKTLGECIAMGIANNLSINNAHIERNKGKTTLSQSRSKLLPVITGQIQSLDFLKNPVNVTTGTLLGSDFPDDPTWQTIRSTQYQTTAGVQLIMPLYNQNIYAGIEVAKIIKQIKSLSYEKAVESLTMQIAKVYYSAQVSLEQEKLVNTNIERMDKLCAITEALYRVGVVMEVDLTRVDINRENLKTLKMQYQTMYFQQLNLLRFLLDVSPEYPLQVEPMLHEVHLMDRTGISDALPELQLVRYQRDLSEQQIKYVRAGYLPSLSLVGYAGGIGYQEKFSHYFHTDDATRNWFGNVYLGFSLHIPLFDANQRRLQIRQYRYESQQALNSLALHQKQLHQNYANASLQLDNNLEQFRMQSDNYTQAQKVYEVTVEKYKEGVASMTELLQDEMRLQNSQSACIQSHYQCNLAQLELLRLSGKLNQLIK